MPFPIADAANIRPIPHPDQPEWLSHVNARVLKVKPATAIDGISSIHLLKTFIHITFLLSAVTIAATDRIMFQGEKAAKVRH